jgi:hypothetical protein
VLAKAESFSSFSIHSTLLVDTSVQSGQVRSALIGMRVFFFINNSNNRHDLDTLKEKQETKFWNFATHNNMLCSIHRYSQTHIILF